MKDRSGVQNHGSPAHRDRVRAYAIAASCAVLASASACTSSPNTSDAAIDAAMDAAADVVGDVADDAVTADAVNRDAADAMADSGPQVIVVPDEHVACAGRNPLRNPYFGDLHVHTRLSFDAITYDVRSGPNEAYAFARGGETGLPPYNADGTPTRTIRLSRPLDFAAVTDHSEYLAETIVCHDPSNPAYTSSTCVAYRDTSSLVTPFSLALAGFGPRPPVCGSGGSACTSLRDMTWQSIQDAAEAAYDRTSACSFTTFVAYEWSGSPGGNNAHRNVIFRNRTVPSTPITYFDARTPDRLWQSLQSICLDSGVGCDVLAIPHNGNVSGGRMFVPVSESGAPYTPDEAARRARLEPLFEVYQHKGASECLRGAMDPLSGEDERCDFEQLLPSPCTGAASDPPTCTPLCSPGVSGGLAGNCEHPSDFARGAWRTGLLEWQRDGVDPFHFGLIASTDTHAGIPGETDEAQWPGHTGLADSDPQNRLQPFVRGNPAVSVVTSGPGGLAVLWAEENARPALFDAMRRRESYGTSGTRITVRFFGGWNYPTNLCDQTDQVATGYAAGVPMGSDLPARPAGATAPVFLLSALRDAMGAPLAEIQIVKGWATGGQSFEHVYDLAGQNGAGASVDLATCTLQGTGADALCNTWRDPDFDPSVPAFYYARVLENPTCRWSRRVCNQLQLDCASLPADSPYAACCNGTVPDTIQERAWTSPIWYVPPTR